VTRDDTIGNNEVESINYDTSFALFRMREDRFRGHHLTAMSAVQKALRDELDVIEHFEMEYKMDDVEIEPDVIEHFEMDYKINNVKIEPEEKDLCSQVFEPQASLVFEPQPAEERSSPVHPFGFASSSTIYPKKKKR